MDVGQFVNSFITQYYTNFDADKTSIVKFYHPAGYATFNGSQGQGHEAIKNILENVLKFKKMRHSLSEVDIQPVMNSNILIVIQGKCWIDEEDKPLIFSQTMVLVQENESWFIANDVFRLSLHD